MADNEQLVLSISADTRAMQRQLDKLVKSLGDVDNSAAQAFVKAPPKIDNVAKSIGKTRFETANLAAQFQDIAVQLQGGASPFTIALQQGTQINQVLGQQGASGAVALLGSAFKSLLTPMSIATIGIIALGGAAIQYGAKAIGAVSDLDDKLKAHGELIKSLKDAYGDAGKGIDTAVKESIAVLKTLLGFKTDDIKKEFQSLSASISKSLSDFRITGLGPAIEENSRKFAAFNDVITTFKQSVKDGQPDVLAFRRGVQQIADTTADQKTRDLAKELLEMTAKAAGAQLAVEGTAKALRNFSADALAAAEQGEAFSKALKSLGSTVAPDLSDREKIMKNYGAALEKAGSTEERMAAARARDDQLAILSTNERKKAAEEAAKSAESAQKRFEGALNSTSRRTAGVDGQIAAIGKGQGELARLETQYRLTEAAQQAFGKVSPEVAAQIAKVADSAGVAADKLAKAKVAFQIDMGRQTALLSPEDVQIANQLASIYGNNVPAALASSEAAAIRLNNLLADINRTGLDVTRGFLTEFGQQIRNGASAMDALKAAGLNALGKIADKLIQMAADNLWKSALGGLSGGGGFNLLSLLGGGSGGGFSGPAGSVMVGNQLFPKFANGTNFAPGGLSVVGERGPELVNLPRGAQVIPNEVLQAPMGSSISAPVSISIDARGADAAGLARLQAEISRLRAELPATITATVRKKQYGGVL